MMSRTLCAVAGMFAATACVAATDVRSFGLEPKTPETSSLFVPEVDESSGVTSYILRPGLVDFNQQSIYFTAKSMTDDGRFLVFWTAPSELAEPRPSQRTRKLRLVDFLTDTVAEIDGAGGNIPYLDVKADRLWWIDGSGLHRRDLLGDPHKDAFTLPLPPELRDSPTRGRLIRFCTHLTPTADGSRFFLDAENDHFNFQGTLNLATGRWEEWDRAHFLCNHGQASPTDANLALCAQECAGTYTLDELAELGRPTEGVSLRVAPFVSDVRRPADAVYPRLWLCHRGGKRMVPPLLHNYATHENFTEDGRGIYYCGGAVTLLDLRTGRQGVVSPLRSAHATMSSDLRYVTGDRADGGWWRGCKWCVSFFNRDTHRGIMVHTSRPAYMPKDNPSRLHPDPHPQFVCRDRYIVCTVADGEHRLNVSVTPVAQLIARTSDPKAAPTPRRIPLDWDPARPVDHPYEVTFDVVRMAQRGLVSRPPIACYASGNAYAVEAKVGGVWQDVQVRPLGYQDERKLTLRFSVPPGTTELSMVGDVSRRFTPCDTTGEENLFAGALSERCANRWRCSGETTLRLCKEGVALSGGAGTATFETSVPEQAAGKPVKLELHLFGISDACVADVRFVQVDGMGRDLAEGVFCKMDGNCSAGKLVRHETGGRLSGAARRLRLEVALSGAASRLLVQRLNLRVGEDLDLKAKLDCVTPHPSFLENREELFAVPKSWPAEGAASGPVPEGINASFFEGLPFKGRTTRFFAYWGVPAGASATNTVPGMVLVHGGGGSAFANWVKFWNDRGYAAISMDLNGRVSGDLGGKNASHKRHAWAGPGAIGCGGFDLLKERPEDQWMYHAVADVVKSHSFLRTQLGVDPGRIGLTGVSWGGVVNCVVASVDDRFRFAIPVYGCGFLFEPFSSWTHRYGGTDANTTRQRKKVWSPLWDPMNYLPLAKIPVHWLNGTNDGNFSLPSLQASYDLVPTEKSLSLRVRMGHSHGKVSEQAVEVVSLADAQLKGAPALPNVGRPVLSDGCMSASFDQDDRLPVASAVLDFTADDSFWWYSNRWDSVSAQVSGGYARAKVPPTAKWAYLSVKTTNGAVVSSAVLDLRKP